MIAADAVLSGRLVIAHRRARDRVSSVEALQKTLAAERVELAVERAFGDGFFRLRRRKMRAQLVSGELAIVILREKVEQLRPRSGIVCGFWHGAPPLNAI